MVEMNLQEGCMSAQENSAAALFEMCIPNMYRVRVLNLAGPVSFLEQCIPRLAPLCAPLLEELSLIERAVWYRRPPGDLAKPMDRIFTGGADRLAIFKCLSTLHRHISPSFHSIQKMSLYLDCLMSCHDLHAALIGVSRTLFELDITFRHQPPMLAPVSPRITMPRLKRAKFNGSCPDLQAFFLRTVYAPLLSNLTLTALSAHRPSPQASWEEYQNLITLNIAGPPNPSLLSNFPMIKNLVILDRPPRNGGMVVLRETGSIAEYLPNLRWIIVPCEYGEDVRAFCERRREKNMDDPHVKYF